MKSHFYAHTMTLPDDSEIEVEVEFTYLRGSPGIMYGDNACPPDGPEVEIIGATQLSPRVGGPVSTDIMKMLQDDKDLPDQLCEAGATDQMDERADAEDRRHGDE